MPIAEAALAALGGIDILVNCAGGVVKDGNPDWIEMSWRRLGALASSLNVISAIRLAQRLTPGHDRARLGADRQHLLGRRQAAVGRPARIRRGQGGARSLTGNLSRRLAPHGITVNAMVPGTVLTPQASAGSRRWAARTAGPRISPNASASTRRKLGRSRCRASAGRRKSPPPSPSSPARARISPPARCCASTGAIRGRL